jgi:Ca2+/Na+ antiporter
MTDVAVAAACQLPGCLFVDVDTLPDDAYGFIQLLFLMSCYGYALFTGANMIGDGAEEMLEFPAWEPIVGSIVLPVLGAVPDAAIVFFSGMGPDAQTQLSVGIGALAGSTVMLLTIPWVLSIYGGLVGYDTDEDEATHARVAAPMAGPDRDSIACNSMADGNSTEEQQDPDTILGVYALEPPADKMEAGKKYYAVAPYADKLWFSGKIMAASLISFVIIQWPAIQFSKNHKIVGVSNEPVWSLLALVVTIFLFIANLYLQYKVTQEEDKTPSAYAQHLAEKKDNQAATEGLLKNYYSELRKLATDVVKLNSGKSDDDWREGNPGDGNYPEIIRSKGAFCGWDSSGGKKLWVEFKEAAGADEKLDEDELRLFLVDKAGVSAAETKNLAAVMNRYDKGDRLTQSGISYWEFLGLCIGASLQRLII